MITSAEEFVMLRKSQDREMYNRAAQDSAPEEVWLEIINTHPEMSIWVVQNKTVPSSILKKLAGSPDSNVREFVARKRKLDVITLENLASDQDDSVRLAVAMNRKTPAWLLRRLVEDSWNRVAEVARGRIKELERSEG